MLFAGRSHTNDRFTRQPETVQGVLKTLSKKSEAKDKNRRALGGLYRPTTQTAFTDVVINDLKSKYTSFMTKPEKKSEQSLFNFHFGTA